VLLIIFHYILEYCNTSRDNFMLNKRVVLDIKLLGILLAFLVFSIFCISILESNIAIFFTGLFYIIIGILFLMLISEKLTNSTLFIFFIFFIFYFYHMLFIYYGIQYIYSSNHIVIDEIKFFSMSNDVIAVIKRGFSLFDLANMYEYHELPAQAYNTGHLAIIANALGNNSILIQKLFIVFISALIPALLFNFLKKFMTEYEAFISTFIYGFFIFITYYSALLLRDIHVALTYMIVILLIFEKKSITNFILLNIILFISFYLRFETGIFLIMISSIYYIDIIKSKSFISKIIFLFILFIIIGYLIYSFDLINLFLNLLNSTTTHGIENAQAGSLGVLLNKLPFGINYIAKMLFSQLQPFPAWIAFRDFGLFQIFYFISGIIWFFVFCYFLYGIFILKILNHIDKKLLYLTFFSILYILLISSTEGLVRRLMAVYPAIYLISVLTFLKLDVIYRYKILFNGILSYILITILYFILKL